MVMPGEDSPVSLKLLKQMVIEPNQQFTIRLGTSTIGTGKVHLTRNGSLLKRYNPVPWIS
jgi:translation elongation factor EF-Tu-like GTPase